MRSFIAVLVTFVGLITPTPTLAGTWPRPFCGIWRQCRGFDTIGCPTSCGCDDYLRKPYPPVLCLPGCPGLDDYHRKPFPVIKHVPPCGDCDDYHRKPLPPFACPPACPR